MNERRFRSITPSAANTQRLGGSMKKIECMALAVALAGLTCSAQQNPIPFKQIQRDGALQTHSVTATDNGDFSSSATAPSSSASGVEFSLPAALVARPVLNKTYFVLNGLHLGMALADVGMTQHCIAEHRCKEGNPMMPSSQAGQISVSVGVFAYASATSYWLKKHKSKLWWAPPAVGLVAHTIGFTSGLRYR